MSDVNLVVLFVVDGMRPDGLQQADTPHIDNVFQRGAYTYTARTVRPSVTLPVHTAMFRGVDTERHGITTNIWIPLARPVPSIIEIVHQAGRKTSAFYDWEQLRDLSDPGHLDRSYFVKAIGRPKSDLEIGSIAARCLQNEREGGLAFVHLDYTDAAGHNSGWMSEPYLEAISNADRAIGEVLSVLDEASTAVIITSDHGGHGKTHGTDSAEDMTIPWGISAPGVVEPGEITEPVSIIDTAPTIADLLGVPPAREWTGRSVLGFAKN
ncbi:MAG: alkaline phosphatase family protein [Chloroflexota bacterium]